MRAVAADGVILVHLVRDPVHKRLGRHRLMKRGVEHEDLGRVGHHVKAAADSLQMRPGMERREIAALLVQRVVYFLRQKHRLRKIRTAVDDAVTHRLDLGHALQAAEYGIGQRFDEDARRDRVVRHRDLFDVILFPRDLVDDPAVDADALAVPLRSDVVGCRVEQLVFQRTAPGVDDKYVHRFPPINQNHTYYNRLISVFQVRNEKSVKIVENRSIPRKGDAR